MKKNISVGIITFLCILEAISFFWTGWMLQSMFRAGGATTDQIFNAAQGSWETGFGILVAGIIYWRAPGARKSLAIVGTLGGVYAVYLYFQSVGALSHWDILNGDLFAYANWSNAVLLALGVVCSSQLFQEE